MLGTDGGDKRNSCLEHCVSPRIQQNLRLERSLEAEQGTKILKSSSLLQVGRSFGGIRQEVRGSSDTYDGRHKDGPSRRGSVGLSPLHG